MILYIFLSIFAINSISFESFKEINLKEELISQPKLFKNQIFLFAEKKVLRLDLESLNITDFFERDTFTVSENGIIYEKNEGRYLLTFEGRELKIDRTTEESTPEPSSSKFKKSFSDSEYIFAQTEENFLYCIRKKDSKKKWKIKVPSEIMAFKSDMKRVYILCGSDLVFCLKRKRGDIIWWKSLKERCFPDIGLLEGNLMFSSRDGAQFLNVKNGTLVGKINVPMDFAPILSGDFLIFFKTNKVLIYKTKR